MAFNYVVTAQKPTAVTHCLTANFTSPTDVNLIISKCTRMEIHTVNQTWKPSELSDGTDVGPPLRPVVDVPLYGRIVIMQKYRPPSESKDLLFIAFERYHFCVLEYFPVSGGIGELRTRANGVLEDKIGRKVEYGQIGIVNELHSIIGLHLYEGLLKVIPVTNGPTGSQLREAFNLRVEEIHLLDMTFIHDAAAPASPDTGIIAVLYQDAKGSRHVKTYQVLVSDKDLAEGPFTQSHVECSASVLIPVQPPLGGLLIVGDELLTYHSTLRTSPKSLPLLSAGGLQQGAPVTLRAWCYTDDPRQILLADSVGRLFSLNIRGASFDDLQLSLEVVGETNIASCLAYLGNGLLYVGTAYHDAQLVHLSSSGAAQLQVLDTFTNIGPIVDFCVVDLDRQGQGQVVTASGAFKDGTLRVLRNGIGIDELASMELGGVKQMWSLLGPPTDSMVQDEFAALDEYRYLVLSFVGETKVLSLESDESIEEASISGLDSSVPTLLCASLSTFSANDTTAHTSQWQYFVQVTPKAVRLISSRTQALAHSWNPPEGQSLTLASCNPQGGQLVVAATTGKLYYFTVSENGDLQLVSQTQLAAEVACVDVHPLGTKQSMHCAVGLWVDVSVQLLTLPELQLVRKEVLPGESLPRSVLCVNLEGTNYLLCGLSDGNLLIYGIQPDGALTSLKRLTIGTQPIALALFTNRGHATAAPSSQNTPQQHVFVACDRPTVVYSSNRKLLFSNVNLKEVQSVCPFSNSALSAENCLALISENNLVLGSIDSIQKLHIRTVPLGEQPRRLAYHESSQMFALLSSTAPRGTPVQTDAPSGTEATEDEMHYVRLLSNHTFDRTSFYQLDHNEHGCSVACMRFSGDETEYVVVGTAAVHPDEYEPTRGRILVFEIRETRLILVAEKDIRGACYSLHNFNGKLLSTANARIQLWKWQAAEGQDGPKQLELECSHHGHMVSLTLQSRGDYIIYGDMMMSINVLLYKAEEAVLEEVARDFNPNWITAAEVVGEDTYIGAENCYNLYTVAHNLDCANDEERRRLAITGQWHLGEFVNVFRRGSLVMRGYTTSSSEASPATVEPRDPTAVHLSPNALLYGAVSGAVGVVNPIPERQYHYLLQIQNAVTRVVQGVGGLDFSSSWRDFRNDRKAVKWTGFLDGDVIESFLDLPRDKMDLVLEHLKKDCTDYTGGLPLPQTVEELIKKVEELTRLH